MKSRILTNAEMYPQAEQPETLKCVIKRLITGGMTEYNARTVYEASINALDVDFYSPSEVRAMFHKELEKAGK